MPSIRTLQTAAALALVVAWITFIAFQADPLALVNYPFLIGTAAIPVWVIGPLAGGMGLIVGLMIALAGGWRPQLRGFLSGTGEKSPPADNTVHPDRWLALVQWTCVAVLVLVLIAVGGLAAYAVAYLHLGAGPAILVVVLTGLSLACFLPTVRALHQGHALSIDTHWGGLGGGMGGVRASPLAVLLALNLVFLVGLVAAVGQLAPHVDHKPPQAPAPGASSTPLPKG